MAGPGLVLVARPALSQRVPNRHACSPVYQLHAKLTTPKAICGKAARPRRNASGPVAAERAEEFGGKPKKFREKYREQGQGGRRLRGRNARSRRPVLLISEEPVQFLLAAASQPVEKVLAGAKVRQANLGPCHEGWRWPWASERRSSDRNHAFRRIGCLDRRGTSFIEN